MNTKSANSIGHSEIVDFMSSVISVNGIKTIAIRINARLKLMEEVRAERKQLADMNPDLLGDIGIDIGAANREIARSYFDLPQGRL